MILDILGCNGPFPAGGGACSGYLVSSDDRKTRVQLDLGSGVLGRLIEKLDPARELDALVLSHLHFDHMSDVPVLGYLLDFTADRPLKLICPETPADTRKLIRGKFDVYPPIDTDIGSMRLEFVRVKHPVETYAVKVICDGATLVYTGDTNECAEISLFCAGADAILADCGLSSENWTPAKPHLDALHCARLAKDAGARELILTHLSPLNDSEALLNEARAIFPSAYLAEAGSSILI